MSPSVGHRWYVVHTHPNAEAKANAHLGRQGFDTYLPRYLKKRRHARRVETVRAALFPRYLFVAIDMATQRWRAISSTVGVSQLVCNGEEPAAVPDNVIASLRQREDENGLIRLPARPRFAPGDRVRLLDGAFADCIALFEGMKDVERVSVLLDLLGRKVRVLLDADIVAAA
ncbi:MAG TPA: transcriptional activator RfaH [Xanthobacteraceae bacterium]|nr:transcriptional activator RfaH [Xanthobacteraceae bacterium]